MSRDVEMLVRKADRLHLLRKTGIVFPDDKYRHAYSHKQIPADSLISACLATFPVSTWSIVFGKTNGHPHWTNRASNLYPTKIVDLTMKHAQSRHTHSETNAGELLPLYNVALDFLYHRLGTSRFIGKAKWGIDYEAIEGRALHASAGNNHGRVETHKINEFTSLKVSPCGKKYENHVGDLQAWMTYLRNPDKPFSTEWKISVKNEIAVHPGKVFSPEQADANAKKGRTFCTPGSKFALGEIMVGQRMKIERGEWISIGHAWGRGGADKLAMSLRVYSIEDGFQECFQEADVTGLDHAIYGRDTDLYMSAGLVYDDPTSPHKFTREFITEYLIANLLCRQTQIMGDVWAFIRGEVPSGLQNTSHMDSWQMAFWFILWILRRAFDMNTCPALRKKMLHFLADWTFCLVLYGDDHVFNVSMDPDMRKYFNANEWKSFLQHYYRVELRDLKVNTTFLSIEHNGVLVHKGSCYLKHYFVINPYKDRPKQPLFLPYRETSEILAKAVLGREIKGPRTAVDIALSCIGHAYGTYAANRDAYDRLKSLFEVCASSIGTKDMLREIVRKASSDPKSIRSLHRQGIDLCDLMRGFPSWETLIEKNEVDMYYHVTKQWARHDFYDTQLF